MVFDFIVVGTGAASAGALSALKDENVLVLDVGNIAPSDIKLDSDLYSLKKNNKNLHNELIGENFESLHNVFKPYISPKLKSPGMNFVANNWQRLSPVKSSSFDVQMSFALGGLANAWGGGLYRFNDNDLSKFPIGPSDLNSFYDRLTSSIGISGAKDDLREFYQSTKYLQPEFLLDPISDHTYNSYLNKKKYFNDKNLFMGRTRLALLSEEHNGRSACDYTGLEFFKPNIPASYNPSYTINPILKQENVSYKKKHLVISYKEYEGYVEVITRNIDDNALVNFQCKKLILASGPINSAKIVLSSNSDTSSKLPILDNPISFVPLMTLKWLGKKYPSKFFAGANLNIVYNGSLTEHPVQMSFYSPHGALRSDLLFDAPLPFMGSLFSSRSILPALGIIQVFYHDEPVSSNYLSLNKDNSLKIEYSVKELGSLEKFLISSFRKIGLWGHSSLCRYPLAGSCYHYAGTLPMTKNPTKSYQTDIYGKLFDSDRVHIVDASLFPFLPAKNHSFTVMANAMRIASYLIK